MKKILLAIIIVLVLPNICLAGNVYEVKKGDTLWGISQKTGISVENILRENEGLDPEKLKPGDEIQIPPEERINFFYRFPNAKPFGDRDPEKIIRRFTCPEEIQDKFIEITKNQEEFDYEIEHISSEGSITFLEQMGFGNYRIASNVVIKFKNPEEAKVWKVQGDLYDYFLVLPFGCTNWSWYKKIRPTQPKPEPPQPKPEPPQPRPEPEPEEAESCLDWEASVYTGHMWGAQKDNASDEHRYLGGNASIFVYCAYFWDGRFRIGPSVQAIVWEGEVDRAVDYSGDQKLFGLKMEHLRKNYNTSLFLYWGKKEGEIEGQGFPYFSEEEADTFVVEASHERWYSRKWIPLIEVGTRLNFAFNESKKTYWDGSRVEDPVIDQGEYSGRIKFDIYDDYTATPTIEVSGGYREFDKSLFLQPRAGIKWFGDLFATEVSYLWLEHSQNDMVGAHFRLNVDEAVKRIYRKLLTKI